MRHFFSWFLVLDIKQKTLCCKFLPNKFNSFAYQIFHRSPHSRYNQSEKKMPFSTHNAYIWISQSETENNNTEIKTKTETTTKMKQTPKQITEEKTTAANNKFLNHLINEMLNDLYLGIFYEK